ncbi:MAG: ABC transporter permease [Candidatus Hydrogenedentes bacterium]|nr:ABC transporter permease [Candidatus Hydrogenedentota bacterium]
MKRPRIQFRFLSEYGMLFALLALCAFFSYATWTEQHPNGPKAGRALGSELAERRGTAIRVLIVARDSEEDVAFAEALGARLEAFGVRVVGTVNGEATDARRVLEEAAAAGQGIDVIACNHATASWRLFDGLGEKFPAFADTAVVCPRSYYWPNFLKGDNLLNVANQIVVIAILAIGMTMVIITGGIDLSVGSLVALSAVFAARLIRDAAGAEDATALAMVLCSLAGIGLCGAMGLFSGLMVYLFAIPPFIVTLGMMLVASGAAFILAEGQSIYEIPASYLWLGRGSIAFGVPNAVLLMALLYILAHTVMTHTAFGRHVYAVGGNSEGARLSGVPIGVVLVAVYGVSGVMAGLGGIVCASQLKSAAPTYGLMYELYVIAAVVVGGTSLRGGEGRIFGTLIGAFIIAVIQNGMNLTGVESYTQRIVLGLVILGAVLLDVLKNRGWSLLKGRAAL